MHTNSKSEPQKRSEPDFSGVEISPSPSTNRTATSFRQDRLIWLAILGMVLLFGLPLLFYPFGRDQGIHAYTAASWLDGQLPYRDVWVQKGPLAFAPHLLVIRLFGRTTWAIRLLDLTVQVLISAFIYALGRRHMSRAGALAAVFVYLIVYFSLGFWHTSHIESFLLVFVLLGYYAYVQSRRFKSTSAKSLRLFLSGVLLGLAPWFKQTAVLFIPVIPLLIALDMMSHLHRRLRRFFGLVGSFMAGVLLPATLLLLYLHIEGMLAPMLEIFRYSLAAYPSLGTISSLDGLWQVTVNWASQYALIALFSVAGLFFALASSRRRHRLGIVLMSFAALAIVYGQRRLWNYHWIVALPFMALLAALAMTTLLERAATMNRPKRAFLTAGIFLMIALTAWPVIELQISNHSLMVRYVTGSITEAQYRSEFELHESAEAVHWLQTRTQEDDSIFIWGHYALIYYLANRENPTRFAMDPPLSFEHDQQQTWQSETISALSETPPAFVLIATTDRTAFEPEPSKEQLHQFPALAETIDNNYVFLEKLEGFEIYAQRARPQVPLTHRLGESIFLEGYDLHEFDTSGGGEVVLTLHWSTDAPLDEDYSVFVQIVDWSVPTIVSQSDQYPGQGERPTSTWVPGEQILDTHILALPDDSSISGSELIVGIYSLHTMERLPVAESPADYIKLLEIP